MNEKEELTALRISVAQLSKEKVIAEQLLGHVLLAVGEPVLINKAEVKKGFKDSLDISIIDDGDVFILEIIKKNE